MATSNPTPALSPEQLERVKRLAHVDACYLTYLPIHREAIAALLAAYEHLLYAARTSLDDLQYIQEAGALPSHLRGTIRRLERCFPPATPAAESEVGGE